MIFKINSACEDGHCVNTVTYIGNFISGNLLVVSNLD